MEMLLYAGIAIMAAAAVAAGVAGVILHTSGKRLRTRLEREYGKRRHG